MKTLIIDGQIWQTSAWYRGMGGYTRSLLHTFVTNHGKNTRFIVVLNSAIPTDDARIDEIKAELPGAEVHRLPLPVDPKPDDARKAIALLDEFIGATLQLDPGDVHYLILAPFLFHYCAVFPTEAKKLIIFYDLIPLLYWEYFAQYFPPHLYFPRFKILFDADIVFAISETTANDLEEYFSVGRQKLVNLDGSVNSVIGAQDHQKGPVAPPIIKKLGLEKTKFILLSTGELRHKNNVRTAQAFARLRQSLSPELKLVVTSFFRDREREELELIAGKDLIFTGSITDHEMADLFAYCEIAVLPSLYEGLGIPVLEGVIHDKPVACSDISVFREIPHCKEALYMFDPYDVAAIADALFAALAKVDFDAKRAFYPAIMEKYSWQRSARLMAEGIAASRPTGQRKIRRRIAVTCPDPRKYAETAVMLQRLHGRALAKGVELVYFIDPGAEDKLGEQFGPDYIRHIARSYDIREAYQHIPNGDFSEVVHMLSGDPQFTQLLRAALSIPGIIYAGQETYLPVFEQLGEEKMISQAQLTAERKAHHLAESKGWFASVSLLARAKGILADTALRDRVEKAAKGLDLSLPIHELAKPGEASELAFDQLLAVLTQKKGK